MKEAAWIKAEDENPTVSVSAAKEMGMDDEKKIPMPSAILFSFHQLATKAPVATTSLHRVKSMTTTTLLSERLGADISEHTNNFHERRGILEGMAKSISSKRMNGGAVPKVPEGAKEDVPKPKLERAGSAAAAALSVPLPEFVPQLRSGGHGSIGERRVMEDAHITMDNIRAHLNLPADISGAFYGVFDGHGGVDAAVYASEHLLRYIVEDPSFPTKLLKAIQGGFHRTDIEFDRACMAGNLVASGTTALAAFVMGRRLLVANAGDCRAVMSKNGKVVELSRDHKPCCTIESQRIVAAGGFVDSDNYLNGQLSVARALGDWHLTGLKTRYSEELGSAWQPGPLTAEPEVQEFELTSEDEFLVLGCDGFWDVFTSHNAVAFARRQLQEHNCPQACSVELVNEALKRNSGDNVSVVTVCFSASAPLKQETTAWRPRVQRSVSVDGLNRLQESLNDVSRGRKSDSTCY